MQTSLGALDAHTQLNRILNLRSYAGEQMTMQIVTHNPGTVGGTPCVAVARMQEGFDWDKGKIMLYPAQPLTALTPEQVQQITESARKGHSWHAYQREKVTAERIRALEAEIATLKQGGS